MTRGSSPRGRYRPQEVGGRGRSELKRGRALGAGLGGFGDILPGIGFLSPEQRKLLCAMTVPQAKCKLWHTERGPRITGTKIYDILAILKKNEPDLHEKLIALLKKPKKDKSKIPAIKYGIEREEAARNQYRENTDNTVVELGLVVKDKFWWSGSSPDGIILENENDTEERRISLNAKTGEPIFW